MNSTFSAYKYYLFIIGFVILLVGCGPDGKLKMPSEGGNDTSGAGQQISPPVSGSDEEPLPQSTPNSPDPELPPEPATEPQLLNPPGTISRNYSDEIYVNVTKPVALWVDNIYRSYKELLQERDLRGTHSIDRCQVKDFNNIDFAYSIGRVVHERMWPTKSHLTYVANYFDLPKNMEDFFPNGLWSHPMCHVSKASLDETLQKKHIPDTALIAKINEFVNKYNNLRRRGLDGDREAFWSLEQLWSRLMMCLSYVESLTTADTRKSDKVAQIYAPKGYQRPDGVLFYEDPHQSRDSRLNIGLYQFTPSASGNIQSCIRSWNDLHPDCEINEEINSKEILKILGSNWQRFNAYCGIIKVTDMFSVQINSASIQHTHPQNRTKTGSLKSPAERCVSLHMNTNTSYNHFGPFQNSADSLRLLMSCTMGTTSANNGN